MKNNFIEYDKYDQIPFCDNEDFEEEYFYEECCYEKYCEPEELIEMGY